jgi:hypothetical protein
MSVHRIGGNPPSSLPVNDISRRIAVEHALDSVDIAVPAGDTDRIMLLFSLLAEVVDAYRFAHKNVTDEYVRLGGVVKRIVADDLREAAR